MKQKIFISIAALILLAGYLYWFQWRPSEIKRVCNDYSIKVAGEQYSKEIENHIEAVRENAPEGASTAEQIVQSLNYNLDYTDGLPFDEWALEQRKQAVGKMDTATYQANYTTCLQMAGL